MNRFERRIDVRTGCAALAAALVAIMPPAASANDLVVLYGEAQAHDMTLQAALAQRDALVEAHPEALSALLPQVNATAAIERERLHLLPDSANGVAEARSTSTIKPYSVELTQTIFDWSAFKALSQSDKIVLQAQADYRAAEQTLVVRVADAYFNLLDARDSLQADLDAGTAYKAQLDQASRMFEKGAAVVTDVRNAQAAYDSSSAAVIVDRRNIDIARRALATMVGRPVEHIAALVEPIPLVQPNPADEERWVKAAVAANPDLLSASYALAGAQDAVSVARGRYLPTVDALAAVNRTDSNSRFGGRVIQDVVGVQLKWNLLAGGLHAAKVTEAAAGEARAEAIHEGQLRLIEKNTRDAYEGVISGMAAVEAARQAVVSNKTNVEATTMGMKVGARTQVDVVTTQQALSSAKRVYWKSRYDYLRALLALKQQAGEAGESDLRDIDALLE